MKKILAVIFILVAIFLGLFLITEIPKLIGLTLRAFSGTGYDKGYFLGTLFSSVVLGVVVYFLFKYGITWLKKTKALTNSTLDEDLLRKLKD
jgi:uncharacterized membrane protein YozB (DUF420 family)